MSTYRVLSRDLLDPAPFNPRKTFNQEALTELAGSLKSHGVLEPLVVRPVGERFQIIAGERRFRAAGIAELVELPCTVRDLDDKAAMDIALIENLQRQDLDAMEEAEAFRQLVQSGVYTVEGLASRLHKSTRHVYQRMSLCKLCPEVAELVGRKRLQPSAAELLVKEEPHRQRELVLKWGLLKPDAPTKELSVRDIKARIAEVREADKEKAAAKEKRRRQEQREYNKKEEQQRSDRQARQKLAEAWWQEFQAKLAGLSSDDLLRLLFAQCFDSYSAPQIRKKNLKWAEKAKPAELAAGVMLNGREFTPWHVTQLLQALPGFCPPNPFPAEKETGK
jgi:ParB family chromosome partitioning protein